MNSVLYHIDWSGDAGSDRQGRSSAMSAFFRPATILLAMVLLAGLATWLLLPVHAARTATNEINRAPAPTATAVAAETVQPAAAKPLREIALLSPVATPGAPAISPPANVPVEAAPVDGLKIASQSWRRGGLGSKALVTFTLRNSNDYAVKDVEISCAFTRRDGSHLTDRARVIPDTVKTKSRKTFARMHVGFVNINADKAKCALVAASRI